MSIEQKTWKRLCLIDRAESLSGALARGEYALCIKSHLAKGKIALDGFSDTTFPDAVSTCHGEGVRLYLVLDDLISEAYLEQVLTTVGTYYAQGIDGMILRDIGLARLLQQYMPDLPLCLSEKSSVYNLAGVETAARLGFDQVILTGLERNAVEPLQAETEVFLGIPEADGYALLVDTDNQTMLASPRETPIAFYFSRPMWPTVEAIEVYFLNGWKAFKGCAGDWSEASVGIVEVLPIRDYMEHQQEVISLMEKEHHILPYLCGEDAYIEEHFESIVAACQETGIYIGNLNWIPAFRASGIPVYGDIGLGVANEQSAAVLSSFGIRRCVYGLEVPKVTEVLEVPRELTPVDGSGVIRRYV